MKQSTVRLVLAASVIYFALLFLVRGLLPPDVTLPLYFLAAPLFLVVLVLVTDLASRVTVPSETGPRAGPERKFSREVQRLTRQIEVGTRASPSYYDSVLLARVREILLEKVCLETGLEKSRVREILKNETLGPGLLGDSELYRLLYSGVPERGQGRVRLLEEAIVRVEAWKP